MLAGWVASPARFREDANAEEALVLGGYADRVLVELLANAVDAGHAAGVPARVRIRVVDGELRVANTGAALTAAGVLGLATLRASAKRDDDAAVGHFGVGFTAVLAVTDRPEVRSTSGGVHFDRAATIAAVRATGDPGLVAELDRRAGVAPALRLPWPASPADPIPDGYVTEVRLPLRSADAAAEVAAEFAADPALLFWALPGLVALDLPDGTVIRQHGRAATELHGPDGVRRFRVVGRSGRWVPADLADRPVEERSRLDWRVDWVLPLDRPELDRGPDPVGHGVGDGLVDLGAGTPIGAPTPTDDRLALPARLIGTFPVDDTRRRIVPGALTARLIDAAVEAYLALVHSVDSAHRLALVPPAGFPLGDLDADVRSAITERLRVEPVLRSVLGDPVAPSSAVMVTDAGDAEPLFAQALPGLVSRPDGPARAATLRRIGVSEVGLAEAVAALAGLRRPARFWHELYEALSGAPVEALTGLPVPLADGRQVLGPRGRLLPEPGADDDPAATTAAELTRLVPGLALVHPAAVHPLLLRLGAVPADPSSLLAAPELAHELARRLDDPDSDADDPLAFAAVVGDLVAAGGRAPDCRLADLLLTDDAGELCPAGELLLPGAALAPVVDREAFGVLGGAWLERWPARVLTVLGVRDGFAVAPVFAADGAPSDLADVDEWCDAVIGDVPVPSDLLGVTDLDLVRADAWPTALTLLVRDREARDTLVSGECHPTYTAWWLRRFVEIDGQGLSAYRTADAADLAGLYDVLPVPLDAPSAAALGVLTGLDLALGDDPADLLARLADPTRTVEPLSIPGLTRRVVAALTGSESLPATVRVVSGAVVDASAAVVPDGPWWAPLLTADQVVAPGDAPAETAAALDLDLASERWPVEVTHGPRLDRAGWLTGALRAATVVGADVDALDAVADLRVARHDRAAVPVGWWPTSPTTERGSRVLVDGSADGVGRALAWVAGRWSARAAAVAAAGADPTALIEQVWN